MYRARVHTHSQVSNINDICKADDDDVVEREGGTALLGRYRMSSLYRGELGVSTPTYTVKNPPPPCYDGSGTFW